MALLLISHLAVTTTGTQHAWMSSCFSWPNEQLNGPRGHWSQAIVPVSAWKYQSVRANTDGQRVHVKQNQNKSRNGNT